MSAPTARESLRAISRCLRLLAVYRLADCILRLAPRDAVGDVWAAAVRVAAEAERELERV